MIKDTLNNAKYYYCLSKNLKKGFEWLNNNNLSEIKCDKYLIDAENIYANVQEYDTKEDANFEAHKQYIDIQCVIKGTEQVVVCDRNACSVVEEYNQEKDIEFLTCDSTNDTIVLNQGDFLILYPQDAHKPSITYKKKEKVKKIVVKVALN